MNALKIGVVGYSGQKFNEFDANHLLSVAFDAAIKDHPDVTDIWVVAGLADVGIASLAYRAAAARGWKTYAIDCARSAKYTAYPVDKKNIIDSMIRGSESETFLAECDVIVRIGGGEQAHSEAATFKERGGLVYEYELGTIG